MFYKQCELQRKTAHRVAWIPEKYAKKDKVLKLRKQEGTGCVRGYTEWEDGWKCIAVNTRLPESSLHSREHLYHRRVNDI